MFVDPCETEVLGNAHRFPTAKSVWFDSFSPVSIVKAGQGKVMQSFSEFLALLQRVGVNSPTVFALLSVDFLEGTSLL